jgi:glycosyltransferase involved in cell wall biosynthesis
MGFPGTQVYADKVVALGLSANVTLTGRVPYEAAPNCLALGDVAVAPKVSTTEGSGKILNYMAMGLPTVAFDTNVSREYLGDDGVYADRGSSESLAEKLVELLDDKVRCDALSKRLRARAVAEHDWGVAGRRLLEIYDLVSSTGGGA